MGFQMEGRAHMAEINEGFKDKAAFTITGG